MYNKILAPLDGSKFSECSLDHVKEIAQGCRAVEVILLIVIEPIRNIIDWPSSQTQAIEISAELERKIKQANQKAEDYLINTAESLKVAGIPVQTVVIQATQSQQAASRILDYANNNKIDLIIMSTHGRSGISRWAFGSVTEKVVRHSMVPVLTISPEGCRASTT